MDILGGRKFIFAVLLTILAFVLVFVGKLTADAFIAFAQVIGGIYVVGNVASTVADKINITTTPPDKSNGP